MTELLTSLDVVNQSFKKSMRGYDAAEVDEFLDHVSESLQVYAQKNKDMERELVEKDAALAEYEKMKNVLHEALITAQKSADEKVKGAQAQADKMIADAKQKAEDICRDAAGEADKLREGIYQIKNIRSLYEKEFRGMLGKFDTMLTQSLNGSTLTGVVDSVLEGMEDKNPAVDATEEAEESAASRQDLEAAYNLLGVDPKEILSTEQGADA